MNKLFTVCLLASSFLFAKMPSDRLMNALIEVESKGRNLIGDHGAAIGILQIHSAAIFDVNDFIDKHSINSKHFCITDRTDNKKSILIARLYLDKYSELYHKETGKEITDEVMSKIWNGGLFWKNKNKELHKNIQIYWKKVQGNLANLNYIDYVNRYI